jgi:CRISPR-associated protein Cas1
MIDRIIEIANPARLSVRDAQLVIERPQEEQRLLPFTTPISEIAVLLLAHPQITLSQGVLSRIAEAGGSVVTIDAKFLPASMQLPVQSHFSANGTLRQADAAFSSDPEKTMAANRAHQEQSSGRTA